MRGEGRGEEGEGRGGGGGGGGGRRGGRVKKLHAVMREEGDGGRRGKEGELL